MHDIVYGDTIFDRSKGWHKVMSGESYLPVSGLYIKEAGFMSARNKLNARSRGNVLHPSFYGDSVHIVCRIKQGKSLKRYDLWAFV